MEITIAAAMKKSCGYFHYRIFLIDMIVLKRILLLSEEFFITAKDFLLSLVLFQNSKLRVQKIKHEQECPISTTPLKLDPCLFLNSGIQRETILHSILNGRSEKVSLQNSGA